MLETKLATSYRRYLADWIYPIKEGLNQSFRPGDWFIISSSQVFEMVLPISRFKEEWQVLRKKYAEFFLAWK